MMKKILLKIKTNWKTILFSMIGTIFLLFLLPLLFGYKLCFAKQFDFDTNAISEIVSILSSIATVIALFVAIYIPNKIAEKQNKVDLFQIRFNIFSDIEEILKQGLNAWADNHKSIKNELHYQSEILAIFDNDINNYVCDLNNKINQLLDLVSDFIYAQENGESQKRNCEQIEDEAEIIVDYFQKQLNGELYEKFKKYLKV